MRTPIFQVDAFTSRLFAGNPAAVMPLERFPSNEILQAIAVENNLAETAFLVPQGDDYHLRWFTPACEVPLCGHATLASGAVVLQKLQPGRASVVFHTASGPLKVTRRSDGYIMDFPALPSEKVAAPAGLAAALHLEPVEVYANTVNYLVVVASESAVRGLQPDIAAIAGLDRSGVIVTARAAGDYDFVSRYFAPAKGIPEDPVTGGAHCMLTPYWARRLNKTEFRAFQASRRGGEIGCRLLGERVELQGACVFYLEGTAEV